MTAESVPLERLPPRLRQMVEWQLSRWPGRIVLRATAKCIRIELFDRSMTIAGQVFTSVFPILIIFAVWAGPDDSSHLADALNLPAQSRDVLDDALDDSGTAPFGVIGLLIVLVSATSLSRALTRAFAVIWELPRPRSSLKSAWRWLAVVVGLAVSLVFLRAMIALADEMPVPTVWQVSMSMVVDAAVAVFVPWILLVGAVPKRQLLPGAILFALVMLAVRPASAIYLPRALEVSADRYGSIGVAFTYLAWLYVVSFCFLAASVLGQVTATDQGWFSRWIRGRPAVPPTPALP